MAGKIIGEQVQSAGWIGLVDDSEQAQVASVWRDVAVSVSACPSFTRSAP